MYYECLLMWETKVMLFKDVSLRRYGTQQYALRVRRPFEGTMERRKLITKIVRFDLVRHFL